MAYENDILTRNDNDELAVRTVQSVGDNPASSYDDVYTRDNNGKLAVRVVGGGDSHNKGYFATQAALEEAYPTGEAGDYAIVGSTDTVWIWDDDNGEWVDTDTKGEVVSVNGKTGTVVLNADDVGAIPQLSTMPTASETNVGNIVQFKGTTTGTYTNGYFYKSGVSGTEIVDGNTTVTQFDGGDDNDDLPAPTPITFNLTTFNSYAASESQPNISGTEISISVGIDAETNEFVDVSVSYNESEDGFIVPITTNSIVGVQNALALFGIGIDLTGFTWVSYAELSLPTENTYGWERTDVQPTPVIPDPLPSQTGNSGKFLTTDGTDASWSDKPLVNTATGTDSLTILGTPATSNSGAINIGSGSSATGAGIAIGKNSTSGKIAIGVNANCSANGYMAIGNDSEAGTFGTAIGDGAKATGNTALGIGYAARATASASVAIGSGAKSSANYAIQIGGSGVTNSEANTIKIGLGGLPAQNYKLLDSDGTIPADRLVHAINKYSTMPTAASTNEGWIVQFTGTTDATYTHGHLYECVSDGGNPATYSWSNIQVQASSGGLPTQTGNAGKFLTTDGTDASWGTVNALQNTATGVGSLTILGTASTGSYAINIGVNSNNLGGGVSIGYGASSSGNSGICIGQQSTVSSGTYNAIAIGTSSSAQAMNAVAIGRSAQAAAQYAIQLGAYGNSGTTNSDANTFKVGNQNGNYEMMSADGTIPEARLADMTNATQGQVLTLGSNNNAVWATPGGGGGGSATATTATLAANSWSSNSQTVNVTGVTSSNIVFVMPAPATQGAYNRADIQCTAQGNGTLTFTCGNVPTTAITVNIIIM